MSHYTQRLEHDLSQIHSRIRDISILLDSALRRAVEGIQTHSLNVLHDVVLDDLCVNRKIREIDALTHEFVARHLPAAGHLRFISSVLRLAIALERTGDYAATICRVVLQLKRPLEGTIVGEIVDIAELARSMLRSSIDAFLAEDPELARETRTHGIRIDAAYDRVFHALIAEEPRRPRFELASLLTIFGRLERVSDQSKNICEEAVFATTGRTKAPKVFRVLFLDERNDFVGHLAAAIASKAFGSSASFLSAGWSPAPQLDPRIEEVADRFSLNIGRSRPTAVRTELPDYPIEYHVVVAINPATAQDIPHIPYHTILRVWTEFETPNPTTSSSELDTLVRDISGNIRALMEKLTGNASP